MIPKIIHQIWLGKDTDPMPKEYISFTQKLKQDNPEFEYKLWTDIKELDNPSIIQSYIDQKFPMAFITDLVRVELLQKFGGIYIDTDVVSKKPLISLYENILDHNKINVSPMLGPQDEDPPRANPGWWNEDAADNWFIASDNKQNYSQFLDIYTVDRPACFMWFNLLDNVPSQRIHQEFIGKKNSEYLWHLGRAKWAEEYKILRRKQLKEKANL